MIATSTETTPTTQIYPTEASQKIALDPPQPVKTFQGFRYTLDGIESLYGMKDSIGRIVQQLPSEPEAPEAVGEFPKKWRTKHMTAFTILKAFTDAIQKQVSKKGEPVRSVPVLRDELMKQFGIEKQTLKELETMGFIKVVTTPLISPKGKRTPGHCLVVLTPKGRWLRAELQSQMTKNEGAKDDSESSDQQQETQTQEETTPESLDRNSQADQVQNA